MRLKIWDTRQKEGERPWFDREVKGIKVDNNKYLYYKDKNNIYLLVISLKDGNDYFEIEE